MSIRSDVTVQSEGRFHIEKITATFDASGVKKALYEAARSKRPSLPPYNDAKVALEWDSDEGVITCKLVIFHSEDKEFRGISMGYYL